MSHCVNREKEKKEEEKRRGERVKTMDYIHTR